VQAVNEMGVGRGEEVCRKGCPCIRQLANSELKVEATGNSFSGHYRCKVNYEIKTE